MKGIGRRVQERNGQDAHDSYWNKSPPQDHSFCKKCHAIYRSKHWFFDEEKLKSIRRNGATRAKGINPLERIIEIADTRGGILITTTHEKLAQRIGKSLHRAFSGNVNYCWSRGEKMARVNWSRDEA